VLLESQYFVEVRRWRKLTYLSLRLAFALLKIAGLVIYRCRKAPASSIARDGREQLSTISIAAIRGVSSARFDRLALLACDRLNQVRVLFQRASSSEEV
jgi:hypothetical protein